MTNSITQDPNTLPESLVEAIGDAIDCGMTVDDLATGTRDTLDDFIAGREGFAERGSLTRTEIGGYPAIVMRKVQVRKGMPRKDVVVVDCGEWRHSLVI